jgi:hypothetical protein
MAEEKQENRVLITERIMGPDCDLDAPGSPPVLRARNRLSVEQTILKHLVEKHASFDETIRELSSGRKVRLIVENIYFDEFRNTVWLRRRRSTFHFFPKRLDLTFDEQLKLIDYSISSNRWRRRNPYMGSSR